MLPIKKLYIDSKFRTPNSKSTSSFTIDVKESLTMPDNAMLFVDDVIIPHSWYLINTNNKLFLQVFGSGSQPANKSYTLELEHANHDVHGLANEIKNEIECYPITKSICGFFSPGRYLF